jgi:hypothetical protein
MTTIVAAPIYINGVIEGYVYFGEIDKSDGLLLKSLYLNILTISLILSSTLIIFSIFYVRRYSRPGMPQKDHRAAPRGCLS